MNIIINITDEDYAIRFSVYARARACMCVHMCNSWRQNIMCLAADKEDFLYYLIFLHNYSI